MFCGHDPAGVSRRRHGFAGRPVADVIESGRMEVRAKVDENDRAEPDEGQPAVGRGRCARRVRSSRRTVGELAGLASAATSSTSASATRQFDVTLHVRSKPDPRMKAGRCRRASRSTARRCADALQRPAAGRVREERQDTTSSSRTGDRFEPRDVKVVQRTESRAAHRRVSTKAPRSRSSIRRWPAGDRDRRGASPTVPAAGCDRR